MVNYGNGKIYKIVSSYTDMVYIGSTTKKYLSQRMVKHRSDLNQWMKGKQGFISSISILLYGDAKIILLEDYPCNSKDELTAREQHYIDLYSDVAVNCQNSSTGPDKKEYTKQYAKQYRKDNEKYYKQYFKQYYLENKEKYTQQQKQYYLDNQEKIKQYAKQYRKDNEEHYKQYFKQHYLDNKENIKQYKQQYYSTNQEKIKQYRSQKFDCECGGKYTKNNKARHEKSPKHQNYINNL